MSGAEVSNPLQGVPAHIRSVLSRLHSLSSEQEEAMKGKGAADYPGLTFDDVMRDKFIALEEDKSQYVYQLCRMINAKTIVEAGTSFGVSTIYLALAATANAAATGGQARIIATENEPSKAAKAREHWSECGDEISSAIELRDGDLRETLKENLENVDFLLLDIWCPMALPTLQVLLPKFRYGAVVVTDNTIGAAEGYKEFLAYIHSPANSFVNATLPFNKGLEVSVYLPKNRAA